jgi:hypothetical protein
MAEHSKRKPPLPPSVDGMLLKLKHHRPRFTSAWTRRYFRCAADSDGQAMLQYFASPPASPSTKPKRQFPMSQITSVAQFDDLSFQIHLGNSGSLLLRCESIAELTCWVELLRSYIKDLHEFSLT